MQKRDVQVRQAASLFPRLSTMDPRTQITFPFLAKVTAAYSERMTCDLLTFDGQRLPNIPVMTKGGLVDGEHYGELDLPAIDDYVVVIHASYGTRHKVIIGTYIPYLANEYSKDAVNSSNKQFTKKLLEAEKPLEYRRILKSGTSVEVTEDGTITVETPTGRYIRIDEATPEIKVEDPDGNIITLDSSGVTIEDANGNDITMGSSSVTINGNLEVLQ
jgi:hypothetical protein